MPAGALITFPASPVPASIEWSPSPEIVARTRSIFTPGQPSQFFDWGAAAREISFTMPNMAQAAFGSWYTFIAALKGPLNYFVLPTAFTSSYAEFAGINWRLKNNAVRVSVSVGAIYRVAFDCEEAF